LKKAVLNHEVVIVFCHAIGIIRYYFSTLDSHNYEELLAASQDLRSVEIENFNIIRNITY